MERLVLDVVDHAPELGVAVADVRVHGRGVQAEARVAVQVAELGRARHADEQQVVLEDPRLDRADPREAVRAQRGQHAQVAGGGVTPGEDGGDPRRAFGELSPSRHVRRYDTALARG